MTEQWIVGQPGGPSGPFYSVVSSTGRVIAMQIPAEKDAILIASLPNLVKLLQQNIADYQRERAELKTTMDKLEALIAEVG
jgi:cell division protein FtsB